MFEKSQFRSKFSIPVKIFEKSQFWSKIYEEFGFCLKVTKSLDFGRNLREISIFVKIFQKFQITGKIFEQSRFWSKVLKNWILA